MSTILVIKLSALGDVLIASAALQRIIDHHQGQQIRLLTAPAFVPLFSAWSGLEANGFPIQDWGQVLATGWQLRRSKLQRVYDLQGNKRSRTLSWLSGAPERIGLWPGWPYTHSSPLPRRPRVHPWLRMNSVLAAVGVPPAEEYSPLPSSDEARFQAQHWLSGHGLDTAPLVLIHAGCSARWQSKRWGEAKFLGLARKLSDGGLTVIWIGGPDDRELNARLSAQVGVNACDAFSISGLIALGRYARFAITNDSGPMHALAAANIPVYSLFGPTDWRLSHGLGQADRVIQAGVDCSPCFKPSCPLSTDIHRCMQNITAETVFRRLQLDNLIPANAGTAADIAAVSADD